jgi:hypothetical protein
MERRSIPARRETAVLEHGADFGVLAIERAEHRAVIFGVTF